MKEWMQPYQLAVVAMTLVVVLFMVQTFVAFAFRVRTRQEPGMPIEGGPGIFLFRADRARGNLIEVLGPFVLALGLGIVQGASPGMLNVAACLFVGGRYLHTLAYYANQVVLRQVGFVAGNMATVIAIVAIVRSLLA